MVRAGGEVALAVLLEIGDADAELLPLDSGAVGPESLVFSGDKDGHACASYLWALVVSSAAHGWAAGVASNGEADTGRPLRGNRCTSCACVWMARFDAICRDDKNIIKTHHANRGTKILWHLPLSLGISPFIMFIAVLCCTP